MGEDDDGVRMGCVGVCCVCCVGGVNDECGSGDVGFCGLGSVVFVVVELE